MITVKSKYFGNIEISGADEPSAANWLTDNLKYTATKGNEILALKEASELFNANIHITNSHIQESDRTIHCLL